MSTAPKHSVMTDELIKLRHEVYSTASRFHLAMSKYFAALKNDTAAIPELAAIAREAGQSYNVSLVALLKHLKSLPSNLEVTTEAERAERTISILSFEVQRL